MILKLESITKTAASNKLSRGRCLYRPVINAGAHRGVEVSLSVHGDVEAGLDRLDGHDSQTHRDQVEQS